jgi:prepilin-type N-terminal cleavage/methylation domain-containing protein
VDVTRRPQSSPSPHRSRSRPHQAGYTLIEMLVVITILGILAAVVTLSMIGVTQAATRRAQDGELQMVQSAMNFMLMDQGLDPADACSLYQAGASGTTDMSQFPSNVSWPSPSPSPSPGASGGISNSQPVQLYPHYLRKQTMSRPYRCLEGGTVQAAGG